MSLTLLVVLQNPYKRDLLKKGWNPAAWKSDFLGSRTGQRLSRAVPESGWKVRYTNANPALGDSADSSFEADLVHLRRTLARVRPDFVLACGQSAEQSIQAVWQGSLLAIPHPAHRLLTNSLLEEARNFISLYCSFHNVIGLFRHAPRFALRQRKGRVEFELLHLTDSCV